MKVRGVRLSTQFVAIVLIAQLGAILCLVVPWIDEIGRNDLLSVSAVGTLLFLINLLLLLQLPQVSFASAPFIFASVMTLYMGSTSLLFWLNGYDGLAYYRALEPGALARSTILLLVAVISFVLGVAIAQRKSVMPQFPQRLPHGRTEKLCALFALAVIFLSLAIIGLDTLSGGGLRPMFEGGYHDYSLQRVEGRQSRWFGAAMTWFLPISALTLTTIKKFQLRRMNWSDGVLFLVLSIPLIAGDRGTFLATLAGWLCIHSAVCRNVTFLRVLAIAISVLVFVPLMQVMRTEPISNWTPSQLTQTVIALPNEDDRFRGSYVQMAIAPFSSSQMTLMGTVMRRESGEPLRFGSDYVGAILAAIPLNSQAAPKNSQQIHDFLIPGVAGGPGFMAVAEMYINFGVLGILFGHLALGVVTARMWTVFAFGGAKTYVLAGLIVVFYALLIWIRNEFSGVAQLILLWSVLFVLLPALAAPFVPWRSRQPV